MNAYLEAAGSCGDMDMASRAARSRWSSLSELYPLGRRHCASYPARSHGAGAAAAEMLGLDPWRGPGDERGLLYGRGLGLRRRAAARARRTLDR
jgi:hypothetical protein